MTTDVETRVRATLRAVAEATSVADPDVPGYVVPPPARSRLPRLALAAAAVAVVVGALALPRGDGPPPAPSRPAAQPEAGLEGPAGGRLLLRGEMGGRQWALYGADVIPGVSESPAGGLESPCWALVVEGDERQSRGCGSDGRTPTGYHQLGLVAASGPEVLVLGVLGSDVAKVVVQLDTERPAVELAPVADPAHPAGARYVVAVLPASGGAAVRLLAEGGRVLHSVPLELDGPVGG